MTDQIPLDGKIALVTGASAGIGRETARLLAEAGANVGILARRKDRLDDLATEIRSETDADPFPVSTDISDEESVANAVDAVVEEFGGLDVLVNNAGIATDSATSLENFPTEQYRTVMGVNVDGMFFTTRAALPHLREGSGNAIFVASYAGQYPRPAAPIYASTKWWTRGFALSLAGAVKDIGVTVVNPSEVRTEFGKEYRDEISQERFEPEEVTSPRDVADTIVYAASMESPNVISELDLYRRDKLAEL